MYMNKEDLDNSCVHFVHKYDDTTYVIKYYHNRSTINKISYIRQPLKDRSPIPMNEIIQIYKK